MWVYRVASFLCLKGLFMMLIFTVLFGHAVQPGLDTSELKTCFSCYTCFAHMRRSDFCGTILLEGPMYQI